MDSATIAALVIGGLGFLLGIVNMLWGPAILARKELVQFQDIRVTAWIRQMPESKVPGVDGRQVPTMVWMSVKCTFALFKVSGEKETWVRSKRLTLGDRTRHSLSAHFRVLREWVKEKEETPQKKLGAPGGAATLFEFDESLLIAPRLEELCSDMYLLYKIQEFVQDRRRKNPELTKYYTWENAARLAAEAMGPEREVNRAREALERARRGSELTTEEDVVERRKVIESKITKAISEMEILATQLETDPNHHVAWQRADGKWFHSQSKIRRFLTTLRDKMRGL